MGKGWEGVRVCSGSTRTRNRENRDPKTAGLPEPMSRLKNAYRECHWVGHQCPSMSDTADHRLIGSPLRSPWRIERSSVKTAESICGSAELSGSPGVLGVLGGNSRSRTQRGRLTGSRGIGHDEGARGWITCDPRGTWPELVSRGTSGEVAGRLVEEKVGVTAGIVTWRAP